MTHKPHYLYWAELQDPRGKVDLTEIGTKIGITDNPHDRMTRLGGGTIVPLECVAKMIFQYPNERTAKTTEKFIHTVLEGKGKHNRGEWFDDIAADDFVPFVKATGGIEVSLQEITQVVPSYTRSGKSSGELNQDFWNEFETHLTPEIPSIRRSGRDRGTVGTSAGSSGIDWEYRANRAGTSVGLYLAGANQRIIDKVFLDENIDKLKDLGYNLEVEKPSNPSERGYVRFNLQRVRNGNNGPLYTEMVTAMQVFYAQYKNVLL